MPLSSRERSRLIPLGLFLMFAGLGLPRFLADLQGPGEPGNGSALVAVLIDVIRLAFLVGLGLVLVGMVRNRRLARRKEHERSRDHG
ncbi:MAG TPA: hypothetical protein VNI57_08790 [Candidatus Saccharimonadales bacterium]|nr:hypothetical protein [Candidatus Saccharimonadales bacterium]